MPDPATRPDLGATPGTGAIGLPCAWAPCTAGSLPLLRRRQFGAVRCHGHRGQLHAPSSHSSASTRLTPASTAAAWQVCMVGARWVSSRICAASRVLASIPTTWFEGNRARVYGVAATALLGGRCSHGLAVFLAVQVSAVSAVIAAVDSVDAAQHFPGVTRPAGARGCQQQFGQHGKPVGDGTSAKRCTRLVGFSFPFHRRVFEVFGTLR
jgi:hypothetical protein